MMYLSVFPLLLLDIVTLVGAAILQNFSCTPCDSVIKLKKDETIVLNFTQVTLDADNVDFSGSIINTTWSIQETNVSSTFQIELASSNLSAYGYGNFTANFTVYLFNTMSLNTSLLVTVVHEEPITIVSLSCIDFLTYGDLLPAKGIISNGTNIRISWTVDNAELATDFITNSPSVVQKNLSITALNVSVTLVMVLDNIVSSESTSCSFKVCKKMDYLATKDTLLVETTEPATFSLIQSRHMCLTTVNVSFGDGNTTQLQVPDTPWVTEDFEFRNRYPIQGTYNVSMSVSSPIGQKEFKVKVNVWDKLAVQLTSQQFVRVNKSTFVNFIDVPNSNFVYNISFGNGLHRQNENSDLYCKYSLSPLSVMYTDPGNYSVTLYAWNPVYNCFFHWWIKAVIPIPECCYSLSPQSVVIPVPDGNVEFELTLTEDKPTPTDVTCEMDFVENKLTADEVILEYMKPFMFNFAFTKPSVKRVVFSCSNPVSSITIETEIEVVNYDMRKMEILYKNQSMSMSLKRKENYTSPKEGMYSVMDVSKTVNFSLQLLNCTRLPENVTMIWDFGDGTQETKNDTRMMVVHQFKSRGYYTVNVTINDINKASLIVKTININMGEVLKFYCDKDKGIVDEDSFQLTSETFSTGWTIQFYKDANELHPDSIYEQSSYMYSHTLTGLSYGLHLPKLEAERKPNMEVVYLENYLVVDYDLTAELNFFAPKSTPLPPGIVTFDMISVHKKELPYVHCTLDAADDVDRRLYSKEENITENQNLTFTYQYIDLGVQSAQIHCFNLVSETTIQFNVHLVNPSFGLEGLFDRLYSMPINPMLVYTTENVYIGIRMRIYEHSTVNYFWTLTKYGDNDTGNGSVYVNPIVPRRGIVLFESRSLKSGLYFLELNVSLPNTYLYEYTNIKFIEPTQENMFESGYFLFTNASHNDKLELKSKCLREGFINEFCPPDSYSWDCKSITWNENHTKEDDDCHISNRSGSLAHVVISNDIHLVTLTIKKNNRVNNSSKMIYRQQNGRPEVRCLYNCMSRMASTSRLAVMVVDESSVQSGATNEWKIYRFNGKDYSYAYKQINETRKTLVLPPRFLLPDEMYAMVVKSSKGKRESLPLLLSTNKPPDGGVCNVTFDEDLLEMSIYCHDWVSNDRKDLPFIYQFDTVTSREYDNKTEQIINRLYRGSEQNVTGLPVQIGDPSFNFTVKVEVKVFDYFGDYALVESQSFSVKPLSRYYPGNSSEHSKVTELQAEARKNLKDVLVGGNDIRAALFISAMASMIREFPNSRSFTSEDEVFQGVVTGVADVYTAEEYIQPPIEIEYIKIVKDFINSLNTEIQLNCSAFKNRFSLSHIHTLFGTVESLTRHKKYLTFDIMPTIIRMTGSLLNCTWSQTTTITRTSAVLDTIDGIAKLVHKIFNSLLDVLLPGSIQDHNVELTENDVYDELLRNGLRIQGEKELLQVLINDTDRINIPTIRKEAQMIYKIRSSKRRVEAEQILMAEKWHTVIQNTLDDLQKLVLQKYIVDGERHVLQGNVLELITEKSQSSDFLNRTEKYYTSIAKTEGAKSGDIIHLRITVYHKNPFVYGKEAVSITTDVASFQIDDAINIDVKLPNRGTPVFKDYIPLINPKLPDKFIHFTFEMINDEDAAIVYIKPHNMDLSGANSSMTLYTLYIRSDTHPTSLLFDFKHSVSVLDNTKHGFKIFIPAGICKKGNCYMALEPEEVSTNKGGRRKRSITVTKYNGTAVEILPGQANFSMAIFTAACRSWNMSDNSWDTRKCQILPMSDMQETVCRCVGNVFSSTFYIPPNTIHFLDVWNKFDVKNASIYASTIAILVLYVVLVFILRRADRKDVEKWAIRFLCDHDHEDCYFYAMTVHTGFCIDGGTHSNVNFILGGNLCSSKVRILSDGIKKGFDVASVNRFVFGTNEPLGELDYLRIWHDNSGNDRYQDWYLCRIEVDDIRSNNRYVFLCDNWLSVEKEDGALERVLVVSDKKDLMSFKSIFSHHSKMNFLEEHIWMSLLYRPIKSNFTRVQRLSCLLALLFLTMITNAMFFRSSEETSDVQQVQLGTFKFSYSLLYVSLMGILITTPPVLIMTILFKKRKCESKSLSEKQIETPKITKRYRHTTDDVLNDVFVKKEFLFPYWTVYIAWTLIVLSVSASGFFLILYSMEWGTSKSEEWLYSFYLSFFESIIFIDPIKAVFLALLFATLLKKLSVEQQPSVNIQQLQKLSDQYHNTDQDKFRVLMNELIKKDPPTEEDIKYMRQKRREQNEAKMAFRRTAAFILFMVVIFTISFHERDTRAFALKSNVENYLLADGYGQFGFAAVNETKYFFDWMKKTLIPALYPEITYNSRDLGVRERRWFGDQSSIRVGPPRIRQVRMNSEPCMYNLLTSTYTCIPGYRESEEDTEYYCLGWKTYINETNCDFESYRQTHYTANSWHYTHAEEIWGVPRAGELETYSGGGYIITMGNEKKNALDLVEELLTLNWIDRRTRAVFVEFTTFNPNVNLFVYALLLLEIPESGGVLPWTDVQAFRAFISVGQFGTLIILCYIFFSVYLVVFSVQLSIKMYSSGIHSFFHQPWNVVDLLCVILGYLAVALYVVRYIYAKLASEMFYDDQLAGSNRFINFSHIVIWDSVFIAVFGCLLFVSVIKAFRILGYNKRFTQIMSVLVDAWKDIIGFITVFSFVFFAFVTFGYLLFGSKLEDYRSFLRTCGSLTNSFIGKNKLDKLVRASPNTAQFFYFSYVGCVIMTLMTIFIAILNKSISVVKSQTTSSPSVFGISDFLQQLGNKVLRTFGFSKRTSSQNIETYRKMYAQSSEGFVTTNVVRLMRNILDSNEYPYTQKQRPETPLRDFDDIDIIFDNKRFKKTRTRVKKELLHNVLGIRGHEIPESGFDDILTKETKGTTPARKRIIQNIVGLKGCEAPGKTFHHFDDILSMKVKNEQKTRVQRRILHDVIGISNLTPTDTTDDK